VALVAPILRREWRKITRRNRRPRRCRASPRRVEVFASLR